MVTIYILVLAFSSWLITHALVAVAARFHRQFTPTKTIPADCIALAVILAFLIVVAAPAWAILATIATAILLRDRLTANLPIMLPWYVLLAILALMLIAPSLGAPLWLAIDAAIIAAALLGARTARGDFPSLAIAFPALLVLIACLAARAVIAMVPHAS